MTAHMTPSSSGTQDPTRRRPPGFYGTRPFSSPGQDPSNSGEDPS